MEKQKSKKMFYTLDEGINFLYKDRAEREAIKKRMDKDAENLLKSFHKKTAMKLRNARERAGITQAQLAYKLNTQPSAISRIESGEQNISIEYLVKICNAIGRPYSIMIEID